MAQVVVEMSGDEAKLFRSYQRIIDQAKKLDGTVKENKQSHEQAFGGAAISGLMSYATSMLSVSAAVGAVTSAMRAAREEADRLGQLQRTGGPGLGQLAQLAETPAQMSRMVAEAQKTFASGGAKTIEQAAAMQFALESAGAGGMRADFAQLQATGLVPDAQLMAESAAKLQKAFGAAKTGNLSRIVSTAFGAGKIGLGSAEQLLAGAAEAGTFGQRIGLSPEETAAAVSTISGALGPEGAATAAEQLFKNIEMQGIVQKKRLKRGEGLQQYLNQIQALEKKGVPIGDILGNRGEAIVAYGLLTNPEGQQLFPQNMANIAQAQRENWMQTKLGLAAQIPENAGAIAAQTAENRAIAAGNLAGVRANAVQAIQNDMVAGVRQRGGNEFDVAMEKMWNWMDRWRGDKAFIRDFGPQSTSPETQAAIKAAEALERLAEAANNASDRSRAAAKQQPE